LSKALRGGRLVKTRRDVVEFSSSIVNDRRLFEHVIKINQAHVIMLVRQRIIDASAGKKLLQALALVKPPVRLRSIEDVHMYVEEEVTKKTGLEIGGNLNIGKSRNDQVATAIRMELRRCFLLLLRSIIATQEALIELSERNLSTVIPGYTHLQPAQPITFAHYLVAQFDAIQHDLERLGETYGRVNESSMGAGALATTSFPIDRTIVAQLLGFDAIVENSLDAVSSRDFILESLADLVILSVNLSRLAEDLIIWSSSNYKLIELPDEFASTSSIMPQKKNPDVLEVIRARTSFTLADLVASVNITKALPTGYNLDLQEITNRIWNSVDTTVSILKMLVQVIRRLKVRKEALKQSELSFITSTEMANMLFRKCKVPFRLAHKIVGASAKRLYDRGQSFSEITPQLLTEMAKQVAGVSLKVNDAIIESSVDVEKFVESHRVRGGPAPSEVGRMIKSRKKLVFKSKATLLRVARSLHVAEKMLENARAKLY
jgi:argininosuccinate lyase